MANIKRLKELLEKVVPFIPEERLFMRSWTGMHRRDAPIQDRTAAAVVGQGLQLRVFGRDEGAEA